MTSHKPIKAGSASQEGRFAYAGLDRVFHEKARLSIMTSLTTQPDGLSFPDLRTLCALSDGNLNRHLAVLQEAGFVTIERAGRGRNSRSLCQVTDEGRNAFLGYLHELERVLADAAETAQKPIPPKGDLRTGLSAT